MAQDSQSGLGLYERPEVWVAEGVVILAEDFECHYSSCPASHCRPDATTC